MEIAWGLLLTKTHGVSHHLKTGHHVPWWTEWKMFKLPIALLNYMLLLSRWNRSMVGVGVRVLIIMWVDRALPNFCHFLWGFKSTFRSWTLFYFNFLSIFFFTSFFFIFCLFYARERTSARVFNDCKGQLLSVLVTVMTARGNCLFDMVLF